MGPLALEDPMTSIRAACANTDCTDVMFELSPELRPGMMTGICPVCGTAWRMVAGALHEIAHEPAGRARRARRAS
jgi:hypothetical protein